MAGPVRFGGKVAKFIGSSFEKGQPRNMSNLWTGYQLSAQGKKIAYTGMAAYGGFMVASNEYRAETSPDLAPNVNPEIEELPMAQADHAAYSNPYQDPLGANGNLVFALHNLRNHGYIGGNQ